MAGLRSARRKENTMKILRILPLLAFLLVFTSPSLISQVEVFPHYPVTVLGPSWSYGAFDETRTMSPAVVCVDTGYMMWYVGRDINYKYSVGMARSPEGITWVRNGPNAVFGPNPSVPFETDNVWVSSVIRTPSGFRMYYGGYSGSLAKLGTATSPDGIIWTRAPENPILLPDAGSTWENQSVYGACVLELGANDFRMWYSGQNTSNLTQIGYATSTDGITWTRHPENPVITVNTSSSWENLAAYNPKVVFDGFKFHMYYQGLTGSVSNPYGAIGYASSPDGIHWSKSSRNPVLGSWLATSVLDPAVILDGKLFRLWFSPYNSAIGYALSEYILTDAGPGAPLPITHAVVSAYPNPFNPSTTITFAIPSRSRVTIAIHDLLGREITTLNQDSRDAGVHRIAWNAGGQASGTYLYRVRIEPEENGGSSTTQLTGKLMLLR